MVPPLDLDEVAAYHYLSVPCHYSNRRIVDRRTPATPSPFFWLIVASVVCTRIDRFSFLFINLFCYAYPLQNAAPPKPSFLLRFLYTPQYNNYAIPSPSILHRHQFCIEVPRYPTSYGQSTTHPIAVSITTTVFLLLSTRPTRQPQHIHLFFDQAQPPRRSAQQINKYSFFFVILV